MPEFEDLPQLGGPAFILDPVDDPYRYHEYFVWTMDLN